VGKLLELWRAGKFGAPAGETEASVLASVLVFVSG